MSPIKSSHFFVLVKDDIYIKTFQFCICWDRRHFYTSIHSSDVNRFSQLLYTQLSSSQLSWWDIFWLASLPGCGCSSIATWQILLSEFCPSEADDILKDGPYLVYRSFTNCRQSTFQLSWDFLRKLSIHHGKHHKSFFRLWKKYFLENVRWKPKTNKSDYVKLFVIK